jgi:hypothetical protein
MNPGEHDCTVPFFVLIPEADGKAWLYCINNTGSAVVPAWGSVRCVPSHWHFSIRFEASAIFQSESQRDSYDFEMAA